MNMDYLEYISQASLFSLFFWIIVFTYPLSKKISLGTTYCTHSVKVIKDLLKGLEFTNFPTFPIKS